MAETMIIGIRTLKAFLCRILVVSTAILVFQPDAHAYIDPGAGSMAFQALLALLIGGLAAVKVYWQRIRQLLSGSGRQAVRDGRRGPGDHDNGPADTG